MYLFYGLQIFVICIATSFAKSDVEGILDTPFHNIDELAELLRTDVRVIAMGDSYSTTLWGRVPQASLLAWPIPRVTALSAGAPQNSQFVRSLRDCTPVESILAADKLKYTILRSSPQQSAFSLPVRCIREIYTDNAFQAGNNGNLFQTRFDDNEMSSGVSGTFTGFNDQLNFRLLYWSAPDPLKSTVDRLTIKDVNSPVGEVDLHYGARPYWHLNENPSEEVRLIKPLNINASGQDFVVNNSRFQQLKVRISEDQPLIGTDKYFHLAGNVFYYSDAKQNAMPGFYYSYLADDGWTFDGFGCNTEPADGFDKRFALDQFVHWLDVTTIRREQPVVFYWYFAIEWLHYDEVLLALESMIQQTDEAAVQVGLSDWKHLLVMPHMYEFGYLGNTPEAHVWMQESRDAMLHISYVYPHVGFASIYDATDGHFFDGSQEGNNWLIDNGFEAFHCGKKKYDLVNGSLQGDLLDAADLHPWSTASGSFFAAVLGDIIREAGCKADLHIDGIIDVNDLLLVISQFGLSGMGDIDNSGAVDVNDLLLLIEAWGECWPIQEPFRD